MGEPLEGYWFNRTEEWAARNRRLDFGYYDFATRYQVGFAPLPAFRGLSDEEYQRKVADLVREIEEEYEAARDGNPVAGVKKILRQDPFRAPTRETKRSPKPLFHFQSREAGVELWEELRTFDIRYSEASEALRSGRRLPSEPDLFPAGCYPPALQFTGSVAPDRPAPPPTRQLRMAKNRVVERGPIPMVRPPVRAWGIEPLARGHPT